MKTIILSVILLLFNIVVSAQDHTITDSLEKVLLTDIHDTVRVKILAQLSQTYSYNDIDKSLVYAKKSLKLGKKLKNHEETIEAYVSISYVYKSKNYGIDTVLSPLNDALKLANEKDLKREKAYVLNRIGTAYLKFGHRDTAFALLQESLEIAEKFGLKQVAVLSLINIAVLLGYDGNTEKEKAYYERALIYSKELNLERNTSIIYGNLAAIYSTNNQLDSALIFHQKSLEIREKNGNKSGTAQSLSSIGSIYTKKGDYTKADDYLKRGYRLAKEIGYNYGLAVSLSYLSRNARTQNKHSEALQYLKEELDILGENGYTAMKIACYREMSVSYEAIGNYKDALKYERSYRTLNDSIYNLEKDKQIQNLEIKYDTEKKEAENRHLRAEKAMDKKNIRNTRMLAFALILGLLSALGWGYVSFKAKKVKEQYNQILEQKVAERTKDLQQANYELLTFNYIASHDIKEPIRNIGSYIGLIRRKLPQDLKENLSDYFDTIKRSTTQLYTLIEDFAKYTTLSKDEKIALETVDLNLLTKSVTETLELTIEKYNGQVIFNNLPQIQSSFSLLFTALKNLIENGLKYNQSKTPTVNIDYQETETHHQIIVSDNGIGIEPQYHDKIFEMFKRLHNRGEYEGSGIGLAIVKLAIDKLGGEVKVESIQGEGSRFILFIKAL